MRAQTGRELLLCDALLVGGNDLVPVAQKAINTD